MYYNYFRDYDPRIGRYVEADPIGLDGGINLYSYVDGSPVNLIDPEGLLSKLPKVKCIKTWHDAKKACGAKFEQARKAYDDYLLWCEKAYRKCKGEEIKCTPEPTEENCSKFETINSLSQARLSCKNNPSLDTLLIFGADCAAKYFKYLKCIAK